MSRSTPHKHTPLTRCPWCPPDDPLYIAYHDEEWGREVRDPARLFEMITLEGAQAGLSWRTVLGKRENYRKVFKNFDAQRVAKFSAARVEEILSNPGIIRNRLKVESTIANAKAIVALEERGIHFPELLWSFVENQPRRNAFTSLSQMPSQTPASEQMSRELKKLGFRFVGPTVCYAFMQAVGMVDDHLESCFVRQKSA